MAQILSLCSRLPYPLTGGAKLRMFYTAKELSLDHDVELLVVDERPVDQFALDVLEEVFDAVHLFTYPPRQFYLNTLSGIVSRRPLQTHYYHFSAVERWLDTNECRFDLLFCNHVRTTEYARGRDTPHVVDLVDAISRNYRESTEDADGIWRAIYPVEWRRLRRYEREIAREFDHSFIITEEDREFVTGGEPFPELTVLTNGVKPGLLDHQPAEYLPVSDAPTIVFLGKMDYFPNEDAAEYFCNDIFPAVRDSFADAEFLVVGASPSERVRQLDDEPGVTVTGFVDDPTEFLLGSDLVVAPMRHGAGLQNKVIEAMALGCPVLTTELAREGIAATDGRHLLVGLTTDMLADKAISTLQNVDRRREIGTAGRELVASNYTWNGAGKRLRAAVSTVLSKYK